MSRREEYLDDAYPESFNATLSRECLLHEWFRDLLAVREILDRRKEEYNGERPHIRLGLETAAQYRAERREDAKRIEARKVAELRN